MHRFVLLLCIVLSMLLLGCTHPRSSIVFTFDPSLSGNKILIEGTTDLPDGALVNYKLTHEDEAKLDYSLVKTDRKRFLKTLASTNAEGIVTVSGGKYLDQVDITNWNRGLVTVEASFCPVVGSKTKQQPAFIIERFGPMGEYLEGSNVTSAKSGSIALRWVELVRTVEIGPTSKNK